MLALPSVFAFAQSTGDSVLDQILTLGGLVDSHAEMWLWLALVLLIGEILTVAFFAGALAVSAVVAALFAWFGVGSYWELFIFSGFSIGSMIWIRPVFVRWLAPKEEAPTNTDALLGQTATAVEQVPAGGTGCVRLANEEWRATSSQGLDTGDAVKVVAVRGNTLEVARG